MALTPSFRRPNIVPIGAAHSSVVSAIQSHDNSITDLNQAIVSLKSQLGGTSTSATTTGASTSTQVSTENVTYNTTISGGAVNNQTGVTFYATTQSDNGKAIILSNSSSIALTLNNGVTIPYYLFVLNQGTATCTATPQQGNINGVSSLAIVGGSWLTIFFDGSNWWAEANGGSSSIVTQIVAGTNVTISPSGGTGIVTVNASGGSGYSLGGTLTSANVVLGSACGTGATFTIVGLDGNHQLSITTGASGTGTGAIATVTFTTSRGHVTYPVLNPATFITTQNVTTWVNEGSEFAYTFSGNNSGDVLPVSTTLVWNVSCP